MFIFLFMIDTKEDKDKFIKLYKNYKSFMWYIAKGILNDAYLAEDAVQDAFIALTRHMDKIQSLESPSTKKFLMTITKSKAIDILRKNYKYQESSFEEHDEEIRGEVGDILDDYLSHDGYQSILRCVSKLDEIYRVVFEYKYVHQLKENEIADLLNVSQKTVNVRIFRARKKLQQLLKES